MIRIQPSAYLMAAVLALLMPAEWLFAAVLACAIHELAHIAAIRALNGRVDSLTIGSCGARIYAGYMGNKKEFLCAAAGPAASFLLVSLCHSFPKLAFCAAVQGIFNLLPVYPMDGGRMLRCLLKMAWPRRAERLAAIVQWLTLLVILACAFAMTIRGKTGLVPAITGLTVVFRLLHSKIPCKSGGFAVQ